MVISSVVHTITESSAFLCIISKSLRYLGRIYPSFPCAHILLCCVKYAYYSIPLSHVSMVDLLPFEKDWFHLRRRRVDSRVEFEVC